MRRREVRGAFSRRVIAVSLTFVTLYTVWAAWEQHSTGLEVSPTLTQWVYTFWGVEVTLLCMKRIFTKRDVRQPEAAKDTRRELREDDDNGDIQGKDLD